MKISLVSDGTGRGLTQLRICDMYTKSKFTRQHYLLLNIAFAFNLGQHLGRLLVPPDSKVYIKEHYFGGRRVIRPTKDKIRERLNKRCTSRAHVAELARYRTFAARLAKSQWHRELVRLFIRDA
ncbi:unnamed protein product [Pieris brassicae]|uniref:Uncharacterized protein n=1 Tax=Pieris brassicae TaxID=7116 RepID=A0A9P0WWU2_PIEBR|nr:unnamed protein product [Pieris brassicae]